jgi:hypothetical protein
MPKIRLDPELVLGLCKKFSGFDGAVKHLAEKKFLNPDTGKPFTKHAIIYAAKKADGYEEWRKDREKERTDTAQEFKRIAKAALSTKRTKKKEAAAT